MIKFSSEYAWLGSSPACSLQWGWGRGPGWGHFYLFTPFGILSGSKSAISRPCRGQEPVSESLLPLVFTFTMQMQILVARMNRIMVGGGAPPGMLRNIRRRKRRKRMEVEVVGTCHGTNQRSVIFFDGSQWCEYLYRPTRFYHRPCCLLFLPHLHLQATWPLSQGWPGGYSGGLILKLYLPQFRI